MFEERLPRDMFNNTVVLFYSDHGDIKTSQWYASPTGEADMRHPFMHMRCDALCGGVPCVGCFIVL